MTDSKTKHVDQHVFRLGLRQNKWIIVMPAGWEFTDIASSIHGIVAELERRDKLHFGYSNVKTFDHVEYLGDG